MIQAGSDDAERFGQLVDVLLDSELPFKESSLGGGEWQVRLDKRQNIARRMRSQRQGMGGRASQGERGWCRCGRRGRGRARGS